MSTPSRHTLYATAFGTFEMVTVTCPLTRLPLSVGAAGRPVKFAACAVCSGGVHGVTDRAGGVMPAAQKGQAGRDEAAAVPAAFAALSGTSATAPAPAAAAAVAAIQYRARLLRSVAVRRFTVVRAFFGPGRADPHGERS